MSDESGICYLVGAGPGDPGLLTVRGRQLLGEADAVFHDYLSSPALLRWARPDAELVYVGKKAGDHTLPQDRINAEMVERARRGQRVVRLKGGDPFLFGRGGEEAQALRRAGVPFEIVPGVSSVVAGPAYAGIPVTHRDHNAQLTVITAHESPEKAGSLVDYGRIAGSPGTKVILMGVERIGEVSQRLIEHGMDAATPVALVRCATTGRQRTLVSTLGCVADDVRSGGFRAPAVIVIGSVVALRGELAWFEDRRPLLGRTIVVTRAREQAGRLVDTLEGLGADVLGLPVIRIAPPEDEAPLREVVEGASEYDWIVFTSVNGVDAFFGRFYERFGDARCLGPARIGAIGPATAARVRHYRFAVDMQPADYVAEEVVRCFEGIGGVEHLRILLPRAEAARDVLPDDLEAMGAIVDRVTAYRALPGVVGERDLERLRERGADWITFTSSSTVENFLRLGIEWPAGARAASIGPVTTDALRRHGIEPAVQAGRYDIPGLVEAILIGCQSGM